VASNCPTERKCPLLLKRGVVNGLFRICLVDPTLPSGRGVPVLANSTPEAGVPDERQAGRDRVKKETDDNGGASAESAASTPGSSRILATTSSSSQRELLAGFQKKEDHEDETYQHHQPTPLHCVESSNGELPEGIVVHSAREADGY